MVLGQIPFVKTWPFYLEFVCKFMCHVNLSCQDFLTDYLDITVVTDAIHVFILDYCCY